MLSRLPHQRLHKPRSAQSIGSNRGLGISKLPRPRFPACVGAFVNPGEPIARSYWQRQALREALLAPGCPSWRTAPDLQTVRLTPRLSGS
jgi:hypothetical protein